MKISILVNRLLKKHTGGEAYFDELDEEIRKPGNIRLIKTLMAGIDHDTTIVSTGKFGLWLYRQFPKHNIYAFDGGHRTGTKPFAMLNYSGEGRCRNRSCIFVDDSFYSGTTRNKIDDYIMGNWKSKIVKSLVVYDGSKDRDLSVFSLYRYHK